MIGTSRRLGWLDVCLERLNVLSFPCVCGECRITEVVLYSHFLVLCALDLLFGFSHHSRRFMGLQNYDERHSAICIT